MKRDKRINVNYKFLNQLDMNIRITIFLALILFFGCEKPEKVYNPDSTILIFKPESKPKINGAKIFGVRPGNPILYTIAATGDRPMEFSADNLPDGANLDKETGILTGEVSQKGTYNIILRAKNAIGETEREFRLVVGNEISLTPPMGCNTWGGLGPYVNEEDVRASAEAMISSDLINHGYCYINIDDAWQGDRGGVLNAIQPNDKFRDMKQLGDDLHARGLRFGLYSTPWKTSYAGFIGGSSDKEDGTWEQLPRKTGWHVGRYLFEANDASQFALWGIDYFKYDWHPVTVPLAQKMGDALRSTGRDIVFELSNAISIDEAEALTQIGNMARTTGDLIDVWDKVQLGPDRPSWAMGVRDVWLKHQKYEKYNKPGHWNMPCPLRVGLLGGWDNKPLKPTRLTPDEQYSHISLWCLWSAPLIIGAPIDKLDEFTLSLLANDEVLEVNQDPLGQQAKELETEQGAILVKDMEDGSKAVGLFNPEEDKPVKVEVNWKDIGVEGKQIVRDLWRHRDIGTYSEKFSAIVPSHGVILIKIKNQ